VLGDLEEHLRQVDHLAPLDVVTSPFSELARAVLACSGECTSTRSDAGHLERAPGAFCPPDFRAVGFRRLLVLGEGEGWLPGGSLEGGLLLLWLSLDR
jgi:hypothetical protein